MVLKAVRYYGLLVWATICRQAILPIKTGYMQLYVINPVGGCGTGNHGSKGTLRHQALSRGLKPRRSSASDLKIEFGGKRN